MCDGVEEGADHVILTCALIDDLTGKAQLNVVRTVAIENIVLAMIRSIREWYILNILITREAEVMG